MRLDRRVVVARYEVDSKYYVCDDDVQIKTDDACIYKRHAHHEAFDYSHLGSVFELRFFHNQSAIKIKNAIQKQTPGGEYIN